MTDTRTLHGRILTPLGWRRGHVHFDSHIRQLQVDDHSGADDLQLPVILPGFIDLHVHGAAGVDLMQGGDVAPPSPAPTCASVPPRCWQPP